MPSVTEPVCLPGQGYKIAGCCFIHIHSHREAYRYGHGQDDANISMCLVCGDFNWSSVPKLFMRPCCPAERTAAVRCATFAFGKAICQCYLATQNIFLMLSTCSISMWAFPPWPAGLKETGRCPSVSFVPLLLTEKPGANTFVHPAIPAGDEKAKLTASCRPLMVLRYSRQSVFSE